MRRQTHCAAAQDRFGPGQSDEPKPQRFRCNWFVVLATLRAKVHVKERFGDEDHVGLQKKALGMFIFSVEYAQKKSTCVHYAVLVLGTADLPSQLNGNQEEQHAPRVLLPELPPQRSTAEAFK